MKRKIRLTAYLAIGLIVAAGCGGPGPSSSAKAPSPSCAASSKAASSPVVSSSSSTPRTASSQTESSAPAEEPDGLTLKQKVGQMFFLCFRKDTDGTVLWTYNDATRKAIRAIQPGGIVLFGENIHTVAQVRSLIGSMKSDCATPPFVGVDQEGGAVQRIRHTELIPATDVPAMWEVGRTGNAALARQVGEVLGSELTVFGFNLDFAPVCDVFSNPKNTVIGTRSFSSDPQTVADLSVALSGGLRSQGIVPVCKHFPGHGDTEADTHEGYAAVNKTLDELRKTELVPFAAQIRAGAEMVMVAHISLPRINGDDTPATMSPKVIDGILRGELGFRGVVVTDALNMGAVANHYASGEAAVRAVQAGADMLLMPEDPQAAFQAVLDAVESGEISEARVDASAQRILALKKKYGLYAEKAPASESLLGSGQHRQVIAQIG